MVIPNIRNDAGSFLVTVDAYQSGVPQGQLYYPCRGESEEYQSLTQLLLIAEQLLNEDNSPQSFHTVRTFFPTYRFDSASGVVFTPQTGKLATFSLHIFFRRNASWQGSLTWLEKKQTLNFRSVLELVMMMDSALSGGQMQAERLAE